MATQILIFDKSETLVHILDNEVGSLPYFDAVHTEQINGQNTLEFSVPAFDERVENIEEGGLAAFKDRDGDYQFFEIKRIEEIHSDVLLKNIFCEHQFFELLDEILVFKKLNSVTISTAISNILDPDGGDPDTTSRWTAGTLEPTGTQSFVFRLETKMSAIQKVLKAFGTNATTPAELTFSTTISGGSITARTFNILDERGSDTGKRFEYGKDITSIKREIDASNVKTALYGFGKSVETPSGEEYRIRFRDVVWTTAGGDDADKPAGQIYVEDPTAKSQFGRPISGGTLNRFGIFDGDEITDEEELLQETWNALQDQKTPIINYSTNVVDLEEVSGLEFEKVRLGDTVKVIDNDFKPALQVEVRVIELRRHLLEPEKDEVILGNFTPLSVEEGAIIRSTQDKVDNERGIWEANSLENNLIVDGSFEAVPYTGSDLGNNTFEVDVSNGKFDGTNQMYWWNWDTSGSELPLIYSLQESNDKSNLFDQQAAVIVRTPRSRPFQYVPVHEIQGLSGDYTVTAYASAFAGTTVDTIATIEVWAIDASFSRISQVDVFEVNLDSSETLVWKRFGGTFNSLPANTEYIEISPFNDSSISDAASEHLIDGVQLVPKRDPSKFQPESDFYRFLNNHDGLKMTNPTIIGELIQKDHSEFSVNRSANQTGVAATTFTTVVWDNEPLDNLGEFNTTTGTFTATKGGVYLFSCSVKLLSLNDGDRTILRLMKNGSEDSRLWDYFQGSAGSPLMHGSQMMFVSAGDAITVEVWSTTATTIFANAQQTFFKGIRIGGE